MQPTMQPTECPSCGGPISKAQNSKCEYCGRVLITAPKLQVSEKSHSVALLLAICPITGLYGGHRWYTGHYKSAILYIFTAGGFMVWWFIDIVTIAFGNFRDSNGRLLNKNKKANALFTTVMLLFTSLFCLAGFMSSLQPTAKSPETNSNISTQPLLTLTPTASSTYTPTITTTSTPFLVEGFIIQDYANMRSSPDLMAPIVTILRVNSRISVMANSQDNNWALVMTESKETGWVYKQLIQFSSNTDLLPVSLEVFPTLVPTQIPTATPVPAVSLDSIYDYLQSKTALQFKEYSQAIIGKPVRERVEIGNVDEQGRVILHGPWSPYLFNISDMCVVVTGVPTDKSIRLSPGGKYSLEATISGIISDYNYFINCEYTVILNYVSIK